MTQIHRKTEALHYPSLMFRLPKHCTGRFRCLKKGSTTYVGLQTKQSKIPTREESLPGRTRNCLEQSAGNAKDGDVSCMPFLTGAKASYSLLAQGASLHAGFTALRPYIKVSTQSFLPTFDKALDTFLFRNSDGGRLLSLPCSFHWILLHTGFPTLWVVWAWGGTSPYVRRFRRLLQHHHSTGYF